MRHQKEKIASRAEYDVIWKELRATDSKLTMYDVAKDHPIRVRWDEFSARERTMGARHETEANAAHAAMSKHEAGQYARFWKDWVYSDANGKDPKEHLSPSGRYKLVVTAHETSPGCWGYTKGVVCWDSTGDLIGVIERNYSSFPFLWMEGHADGHDYLIGGENYQGQTFIQLDTGEVRDNLSDGANKGFGFCWASYKLLDGKTLLVNGCFWACPYEYKFFDVSNPMSGWPEIELPEDLGGLDSDEAKIDVGEDGFVTWTENTRRFKETGEYEREVESANSILYSQISKLKHQKGDPDAIAKAEALHAEHETKYDYDDREESEKWEAVVARTIKLRCENGAFVVVDDWKSDWWLAEDAKRKGWQEKERERQRRMMEEEPLFQSLVEKYGRNSFSMHFSYPSMVMRWDGESNDAFFCVSIPAGAETPDRTAKLEWGNKVGEISVTPWIRGKGDGAKIVFPRNLEGIHAAWNAAQAHIGGA
jgi:hypothetical protein